VSYAIAAGIGGLGGAITVFAILAVGGGAIYHRSRGTAVHAGNVNAEWAGAIVPDEDDQPAAAA
jgi:PiT family inorganic phosphate transporter